MCFYVNLRNCNKVAASPKHGLQNISLADTRYMRQTDLSLSQKNMQLYTSTTVWKNITMDCILGSERQEEAPVPSIPLVPSYADSLIHKSRASYYHRHFTGEKTETQRSCIIHEYVFTDPSTLPVQIVFPY